MTKKLFQKQLTFQLIGQKDVKKKIVLNRKVDESTIKMDDVKKGKVKTQKDKLRKLRGR